MAGDFDESAPTLAERLKQIEAERDRLREQVQSLTLRLAAASGWAEDGEPSERQAAFAEAIAIVRDASRVPLKDADAQLPRLTFAAHVIAKLTAAAGLADDADPSPARLPGDHTGA